MVSPVQVISVIPLQLVAIFSSGVPSFVLGLLLLSSRPWLQDLLLFFSLLMSWRFSEAARLVRGAAAANSHPAVLVQRLSTSTTAAAGSKESAKEKSKTAIMFESRLTFTCALFDSGRQLDGFESYFGFKVFGDTNNTLTSRY